MGQSGMEIDNMMKKMLEWEDMQADQEDMQRAWGFKIQHAYKKQEFKCLDV